MERRHFLKIAVGAAAATTIISAAAVAAPLSTHPLTDPATPQNPAVRPAVTTEREVETLQPEQVRWHHGWRRHWGWRRRHWGWRRRHWGWRRHHWHRHWRRRYW